jgi:hypothetical protein
MTHTKTPDTYLVLCLLSYILCLILGTCYGFVLQSTSCNSCNSFSACSPKVRDINCHISLVRIEFAKVDSSAIQERMFSAAAAAMTNRQTQMSQGVHEKRTLLFANKQFMQKIGNF